MKTECERCRGHDLDENGRPQMLDYCVACSKDLCQACMAKGCCGTVPALSGNAESDDQLDGITKRMWEKAQKSKDK